MASHNVWSCLTSFTEHKSSRSVHVIVRVSIWGPFTSQCVRISFLSVAGNVLLYGYATYLGLSAHQPEGIGVGSACQPPLCFHEHHAQDISCHYSGVHSERWDGNSYGLNNWENAKLFSKMITILQYGVWGLNFPTSSPTILMNVKWHFLIFSFAFPSE